jgi:uncharacterized membrane protein
VVPVLVWLGLRVGRDRLRGGGLFLLAIAVGLAAVLLAHNAPVHDLPLLNPRTLASLFVAGALFGAAALHRRAGAGTHGTTRAVLIVVGHMLAVLILSAEIDAHFDRRMWAEDETRAPLARQLTLSIAWAAYAVALIAAGLRRRYRPIRLLAIALFAITVVKVFAVDLARLDRVSRMLSVIGLGLLLLVASYLYQRLRSAVDEEGPVAGDPAAGEPPTADQASGLAERLPPPTPDT